MIQYGGKTFVTPTMSNTGTSFDVPVVRVHECWDIKKLNGVNLPTVHQKIHFPPRTGLMILDMPIKFPGSGYRLPTELSGFSEIIKQVATNHGSDMYCYITIDESGQSRTAGAHVDGFQGDRIGEPKPADYSDIATDSFPVHFFETDFNVKHLDRRLHNFFIEFDRQATKVVHYPLNTILGMDCYTVHAAATVTGPRTFFRMSFSARKFDRLGNTLNPLFNYNWSMCERAIAETLQ